MERQIDPQAACQAEAILKHVEMATATYTKHTTHFVQIEEPFGNHAFTVAQRDLALAALTKARSTSRNAP